MSSIDELREPMTDVENTLYILKELSATESKDLEYAEIDVYYEDDSGNEGACQYDMPMIADAAITTIIEQAEEVDKLNKEIELLYDMATASFSSQFIDSELKKVGAK